MSITVSGGISLSGGFTVWPQPTLSLAPQGVAATRINDTTVRLTITDPVNTGSAPILSYTGVSTPGGFTATSNTNTIDIVGDYKGSNAEVEYNFDGSSFYEIPYNAAFQFSNNWWTIEAFITPTTSGTTRGIVNNWNIGGAFGLEIDSSNRLNFYYTASSTGINTYYYTSNTTIQTNARTHIAVVKGGGTIQFYINGVKDSSTHTMPAGFGYYVYYYDGIGKPLRYGIGSDNTNYFTGKISNLRIVYGNAVYSGNFTVPSLPLTVTQPAGTNISAIDGTSFNRTLLLVMTDTNLGKDYSTNNWISTPTGSITASGVSYTFTAYVTTSVGNSPNSLASNVIQYGPPSAPTIGTATYASATSATVTFTPPADDGGSAITSYTVVSSPPALPSTNTSSPITMTNLTTGTTYTFTVFATNKFGNSANSDASNSIVLTPAGQIEFTTVVTTTWTVPAGVTQISMVCVGGGGGGMGSSVTQSGGGGGGGGLAYRNNVTVTPNDVLTIRVGSGGSAGTPSVAPGAGGESFVRTSGGTFLCRASGGAAGINGVRAAGGTRLTGDGGGTGGQGGPQQETMKDAGGGGGAAGYSGNGGDGGYSPTGSVVDGSTGSGGGGGGGAVGLSPGPAGSGGGVGILGQGTSGSAGLYNVSGGNGQAGSTAGNPRTTTYGGGGGGAVYTTARSGVAGGQGAVRIIWAGNTGITRAFPNTNTGNL